MTSRNGESEGKLLEHSAGTRWLARRRRLGPKAQLIRVVIR